MDIDWITAVKSTLSLLKNAIGLVKDAKDLLPAGNEKTVITQTLEEAEKAAKLAEVQIAKSLGYNLCQCTFPPQIMLSIGYEVYSERFKCPNCGKIFPNKRPPKTPELINMV
ncbi:MAG: hypothetical protein HY279_05255 [Nitrospinae bacterium]|nr:hypothetical protein [Nitrospinota bacterium]